MNTRTKAPHNDWLLVGGEHIPMTHPIYRGAAEPRPRERKTPIIYRIGEGSELAIFQTHSTWVNKCQYCQYQCQTNYAGCTDLFGHTS